MIDRRRFPWERIPMLILWFLACWISFITGSLTADPALKTKCICADPQTVVAAPLGSP